MIFMYKHFFKFVPALLLIAFSLLHFYMFFDGKEPVFTAMGSLILTIGMLMFCDERMKMKSLEGKYELAK